MTYFHLRVNFYEIIAYCLSNLRFGSYGSVEGPVKRKIIYIKKINLRQKKYFLVKKNKLASEKIFSCQKNKICVKKIFSCPKK